MELAKYPCVFLRVRRVVCAYSKILNVQRFSSFYAIYLILSLEMSDEPIFREDILTLPDKYIFYCR